MPDGLLPRARRGVPVRRGPPPASPRGAGTRRHRLRYYWIVAGRRDADATVAPRGESPAVGLVAPKDAFEWDLLSEPDDAPAEALLSLDPAAATPDGGGSRRGAGWRVVGWGGGVGVGVRVVVVGAGPRRRCINPFL